MLIGVTMIECEKLNGQLLITIFTWFTMRPNIKVRIKCHTYWGFERNASEPTVPFGYCHLTDVIKSRIGSRTSGLVSSLTKMGLVNKFKNFRLLLTDGVAYNVAARNILKNIYTNMIHITFYTHMTAGISSKMVALRLGRILWWNMWKKCLKKVLVVLKSGEKFKTKMEKVGLLFPFHVLPDGTIG